MNLVSGRTPITSTRTTSRGPRKGPRFLGSPVVPGSLLATLLLASPLQAQSPPNLNPDGKGNFTFQPGIRVQPRYSYDAATGNNDFFIARVRLKVAGKASQEASYGIEIKIDNTGKYAATPSAQVENAWLNFPIKPDFHVRAGFYDAPFSRNALTSDSKLLLLDRSLIKDALTALGFADNTIGVLAHGRPSQGRFEYAAGIFDNLAFESTSGAGTQARSTMQIARAGIHLLDPAAPGGYGDYKSSYLGQGRRLSIGVNGGLQTRAYQGSDRFDITVVGGDLLFNQGPFVLETEFDDWREDVNEPVPGGKVDTHGSGWYVQGGYMVTPRWELAARYQEVDADAGTYVNGVEWTTVGTNFYFRDHNLKLQAEYTAKREQLNPFDNDLVQVQLQLDY